MTDNERERLIDAWKVVLELEADHDLKRLANNVMVRRSGERSTEQVERMEDERGLRA